MTLENRLTSCIPSIADANADAVLGPPPPDLPAPTPPVLRSPLLLSGRIPGPLPCSVCRGASRGLSDTPTGRLGQKLAAGWTLEISRHGLTPSSAARNITRVPGVGQLPSAAEPRLSSTTSPGDPAAERATAHLGKRSSERERRVPRSIESPSFESPPKKPRLVPPGSISLPAQKSNGELASMRPDPTSPLFFSNSARHMTSRLPSFTASEAATPIMGPAQRSQEGITTLRLPKGQVSASSSVQSSGTPGSWTSTELSVMSPSPDGRVSSPARHLQGIGIAEFLEHDPRPTFVIDLNNSTNFDPGMLQIVYANASLRAARGVLEGLQENTAKRDHDVEFARFKAWVLTFGSGDDSIEPCFQSVEYSGVSWTCSTMRNRFRFVCGNMDADASTTPVSPANVHKQKESMVECEPGTPDVDYFGKVEDDSSPLASHPGVSSEPASRPGTAVDDPTPSDNSAIMSPQPIQLQTTFDWTRIPMDNPNLSPHHRFARSVDWASTSLGPIEDWPADLRIMSSMIMGSPHPAAMYWGKDYIAIYNEAYLALAGQKHPRLMGSRYQDAWPEIWDHIKPVMDGAFYSGDATMKHDDSLYLTRHGFLEETFFNWALIPLVGGGGNVVALYNPAFENTRRKISERRMLTLREIGVKTSQARDVKDFWGQVRKGLEYNEFDVPFALIYSVDDGSGSEASSMHSGNFANPPQIILEGSLGVPEGHSCAPTEIDLRSSMEGFAEYMRASMSHLTGPDTPGEDIIRPIILSEEDGTLPSHLLHGLTWRGFGDPCRTIVLFPVHPTTAGDSVVGFIVLGVNPRRPYDSDYQLFVNLLSRQLATSMASVVLFEEEIKRGQRAARQAALDRQELSMQLHLRTQEAVESEYRFTRMAELGPVGMFIADGKGHITYCNEMWWTISGRDRSTSPLDAWMTSIQDEDRPGVEDAWRRLIDEKSAITHEFRFKRSRPAGGQSADTWALINAYPEKDEFGNLVGIFGCITDISKQKWAEDFQKQRRDEAVELKRQQENFIDITSHEMRNPLSAILQCADEIASCLDHYRAGDTSDDPARGLNLLVDSCMEAANTISLCANHQKRIVDDISTLSKLDSNLILVAPVDVQPVMVVRNVLKMFDAELGANDIKINFEIKKSYRDLAVDWVKLDPSRLRQVLINLMTNAIKFTQGRPTRLITVSLGASKGTESADLSYIPPRNPKNQNDITDEEDWANGEKVNLHFAVTDTGSGLDEEEKQLLFHRFSQVSPRTHVQYNGSGLGLFICRILIEMQGGQIGVKSQDGEGSTFAFYIKSRKSEHPHPHPDSDLDASNPSPRASPARMTVGLTQPPRAAMPITATYKLPRPVPGATRPLDVLIVEDNLVNQKVLQRQLQLTGNKTLVANHGGEALKMLRRTIFWDEEKAAMDKRLMTLLSSTPWADGSENGKKNVSVILMDLEMPVMDGMTCTREIRRLEGSGVITKHIPIIAVTAYARAQQIEDAKAAGVDDVISKPFRIPELIPKIEELVGKYNMWR